MCAAASRRPHLLTSVLFSGASGSSVANAAFGAKVMVPALVSHGYPLPRAAAIVASTAMLDNIIPPSIAFLILATATNLSVGSLLVGGFVAGGVLALALGIGLYLTIARRDTDARTINRRGKPAPLSRRSRPSALASSSLSASASASSQRPRRRLWPWPMRSSSCLALRSINGRSLADAFRQSAGEAAAVGLLIGTAAPFALHAGGGSRIRRHHLHCHISFGGGPFAVMLLANIVLLIAGLFLDIGAAILLLAPLLLPAAIMAGIDPIQFGVIVVVNLMIHGLTPPLGILVYVTSGVSRRTADAGVSRSDPASSGAARCSCRDVRRLGDDGWPLRSYRPYSK